MSCSPPPARSTGFAHAAVGGRPLPQARGERVGESRHLEPGALGQRGGDPAVPAAVRQHGDAPAPHPARAQEAVGQVDQLVRRAHPLDPRRAAGGVDRAAVAGERAGVRAHRAGGGLGVLDPEQHDRLPRRDRGRRRRRERPPVAEVLGVEGDQLGRVVGGERADEVGRLEIDLVARRDEAREPERGLAGQQPQLQREVAALGDQADRAGRQRVGDELEARRGVEHPEAVRPEQRHAGLAHARPARGLARPAGGDRDDRPRAGGDRLLDRRLDCRGRHRDHDQLGGIGQLAQGAQRRAAQHLAAAVVDEMHGAAGLAPQRAARQPVAPLDGIVGRADHRDGAGVEERLEVPRRGHATRRHGAASGAGGGSPRPHASTPPSTTIVVPVT